jgi:hypothetical protein
MHGHVHFWPAANPFTKGIDGKQKLFAEADAMTFVPCESLCQILLSLWCEISLATVTASDSRFDKIPA